jgi:hypothetical protein
MGLPYKYRQFFHFIAASSFSRRFLQFFTGHFLTAFVVFNFCTVKCDWATVGRSLFIRKQLHYLQTSGLKAQVSDTTTKWHLGQEHNYRPQLVWIFT